LTVSVIGNKFAALNAAFFYAERFRKFAEIDSGNAEKFVFALSQRV
jgi:hypothetical protein